MKIAVFMGTKPPTLGGNYTFYNEVFQALIKEKTNHTFVIFGRLSEEQIKLIDSTSIHYYSLERSSWEKRKYKIKRIINKILTKLPIIRKYLSFSNQNWLKEVLEAFAIELAWFVTPTYYIELDVPYIFTVWDLQHRLQPWFPEVSSKGRWNSREKKYSTATQRASAVITGTEVGKSDIVSFYRVSPNRVKVIPFPTPSFAQYTSDKTGQEVLEKYQIPTGFLFYPAQFWPHKNHIGLLLAVRHLRDKYNLVFPIVFVGSDQGNLKYIRRMIDKLDLSSQVYCLDFVPLEDLIALYRKAFALVFMTFFGPDNLPPLEAFALGCPVIASKIPGSREQLGDAALLVDPENEEQIALAIKSLYDDEDLRQTLINRGLNRATEYNSVDYVEEVLSVISEFEVIRRCWGNSYEKED